MHLRLVPGTADESSVGVPEDPRREDLGAVDGADVGKLVPQLAVGCDPSVLELSPVEGFLLSRIDGATPWKVLREMGGLSPEEVDMCLESWTAMGMRTTATRNT